MAISVEGLGSAVKGRVVDAGAPDYDEARALYNGMIDKRPAAIAYCRDEADVVAALRYGASAASCRRSSGRRPGGRSTSCGSAGSRTTDACSVPRISRPAR